MKNDFEIMCRELDKCKRCCFRNEVVCASVAIKKYVGNDRNKLLKLKALSRVDVRNEYALVFSIAAFTYSVFSVIFTSIDQGVDPNKLQNSDIYLILIIFFALFTLLVPHIRNKPIMKWQNFIIIALEEFERNEFN